MTAQELTKRACEQMDVVYWESAVLSMPCPASKKEKQECMVSIGAERLTTSIDKCALPIAA